MNEEAVETILSEYVESVRREFIYHKPPNKATEDAHEAVRAAFRRTAMEMCELLPSGLEKIRALNKLREGMFWANASIAIHPPGSP